MLGHVGWDSLVGAKSAGSQVVWESSQSGVQLVGSQDKLGVKTRWESRLKVKLQE
jgi:hypothetical protein